MNLLPSRADTKSLPTAEMSSVFKLKITVNNAFFP